MLRHMICAEARSGQYEVFKKPAFHKLKTLRSVCCRRFWRLATLAQLVERLTRNEQVDSSILSSGSMHTLHHIRSMLGKVHFRCSMVRIQRSIRQFPSCLIWHKREWRNGSRAGFRFLCLRTCGFKSHLAHDKGLIRTRLIEVFGGRVWASGAAVMSFLQNTCQTCDNTYRLQRSTCLAAIAITAVS